MQSFDREEPATQKRDGPYAVGSTRRLFQGWRVRSFRGKSGPTALGERAIVVQARWRQIRHTRRYKNAKKGAMLVQARHRRYIARRLYLKTTAASILAQSARRALMARKRVAALRRNRAASRVAAAWRGRKERRAYELLRTNAVTVQKVQRRAAPPFCYEKMANEAREQAKLENRLAAMEAKLRTPSPRMKRRKEHWSRTRSST